MSELIKAWIDADGTTAQCTCGMRWHTPAGVITDPVLKAAEHHAATTGHHWPTGEEDAAQVGNQPQEQR